MTKAAPVVTTSKNTSQQYTIVYNVGDHVYYSVNGVSAPFVITQVNPHGNVAKDGTSVSYTIEGDISGTTFPTKVSQGPFKNVPLSALTDRT